MFNIYLNNFFYILNDVDTCIYVDDTTHNVCISSLKVVIERLKKSPQLAMKWFSHNYMKLNGDKWLVYDDYESIFDVLLNRNKSFSIHPQNI